MKRFAEFIIGNRLIILSVITLLSLFFLYNAVTRLSVRTIFPDLLPKNHAYVNLHNEVRDKFGGANQVVIMVQVRDVEDGGKYEDIFNYETLSTVKAIEEEALKLNAVDRNKIMSLASRKIKDIHFDAAGMSVDAVMFPDVPDTPEGLEKLKRTVYGLPWCYPGLVSLDSKKTIITIDFFEERIDYKTVFNQLRDLRDKYENENIIIAIAGEPMHLGYIDYYVMDVVKILFYTVLAMMIVFYIYFRSKRGMFLPIVAAAVSAVWGLGFMGLMGFNLDPLVLVFPFLIAAMAASHSVQVIKRYKEEAYEAGNTVQACKNVIEHLFKPGFAGIITDSSGIIVIALTPIPILQKITLSCAFWAFATVLIAMILVPILLSFMPLKVSKEGEGFLDRLLFRTGKWITARGKYYIIAVSAVLLVWGGYYCNKIDIGSNVPGSEVLWPWHRYNVDSFRITFAMPLLNPLYIILQGDKPQAVGENPELWRELDRFMRHMRRTPGMRVIMTQSMLQQVAGRNKGVRDNDPNWLFMPSDDDQLRFCYKQVLFAGQPGEYDKYVDTDERAMNIIIFCRDKTADTIKVVIDRINDFIREESIFGKREDDVKREGFDRFVYWLDGFFREKPPPIPEKPEIEGVNRVYYRLAGGAVGVQAGINEALTLYQIWTFILALLTVMILCTIVFRSPLAGIIIIAPLVLSNFLAFTFMAFSKPYIALTTATLPVASVGIGLGVDYGIYLVSRIVEEYKKKGVVEDAICIALGTTGKAIVYIGTTLICGIVFWFISKMMFQALMGLLLAIILLFNMIGALLIIPSAIAIFKPKFIERGI